MPHFHPRKLRPMRPEHYRRITLRMRGLICGIEQGCEPQTMTEQIQLGRKITALHRAAIELDQRHRAQDPDLFQPLPEPPDAS